MKLHFYGIALLLLVVTLQPAVRGQEPVPGPSAQPSLRPPIKLNVVVSRYQNDKKLSSLPYSISVSSNSTRASMRMGAQVPYPTAPASEGKPAPGYSYRDVGISIDAQVSIHEPGLYRVDLSVADTSIATGNQVQGAPAISGVPVFKNFSIGSNTVVLKDGQTTQLTSAADPISGETMRIDVTLTVAK